MATTVKRYGLCNCLGLYEPFKKIIEKCKCYSYLEILEAETQRLKVLLQFIINDCATKFRLT